MEKLLTVTDTLLLCQRSHSGILSSTTECIRSWHYLRKFNQASSYWAKQLLYMSKQKQTHSCQIQGLNSDELTMCFFWIILRADARLKRPRKNRRFRWLKNSLAYETFWHIFNTSCMLLHIQAQSSCLTSIVGEDQGTREWNFGFFKLYFPFCILLVWISLEEEHKGLATVWIMHY